MSFGYKNGQMRAVHKWMLTFMIGPDVALGVWVCRWSSKDWPPAAFYWPSMMRCLVVHFALSYHHRSAGSYVSLQWSLTAIWVALISRSVYLCHEYISSGCSDGSAIWCISTDSSYSTYLFEGPVRIPMQFCCMILLPICSICNHLFESSTYHYHDTSFSCLYLRVLIPEQPYDLSPCCIHHLSYPRLPPFFSRTLGKDVIRDVSSGSVTHALGYIYLTQVSRKTYI